jgi:hypothetical protein
VLVAHPAHDEGLAVRFDDDAAADVQPDSDRRRLVYARIVPTTSIMAAANATSCRFKTYLRVGSAESGHDGNGADGRAISTAVDAPRLSAILAA